MKKGPVFHWGKYKGVDKEKSVVMLHIGDSFFNQLIFSESLHLLGTYFDNLRRLKLFTLCNTVPHFPLIPSLL